MCVIVRSRPRADDECAKCTNVYSSCCLTNHTQKTQFLRASARAHTRNDADDGCTRIVRLGMVAGTTSERARPTRHSSEHASTHARSIACTSMPCVRLAPPPEFGLASVVVLRDSDPQLVGVHTCEIWPPGICVFLLFCCGSCVLSVCASESGKNAQP